MYLNTSYHTISYPQLFSAANIFQLFTDRIAVLVPSKEMKHRCTCLLFFIKKIGHLCLLTSILNKIRVFVPVSWWDSYVSFLFLNNRDLFLASRRCRLLWTSEFFIFFLYCLFLGSTTRMEQIKLDRGMFKVFGTYKFLVAIYLYFCWIYNYIILSPFSFLFIVV